MISISYKRFAVPGGDKDTEGLGRFFINNSMNTLSCYSGGGPNGYVEYRDNPLAESKEGLGPIPEGEYTMTLLNDGGDYENKGPLVIGLTPSPKNNMYGRSGFLIHGDNALVNFTASDGCIIAPHNLRAYLVNLVKAGNNILLVT